MAEIYLFPGEASARRGIGADLFGRYPDMVDLSEQVLGYSLYDLCVNAPHGKVSRTLYAGPAMFVVNAMTYRAKVRTDPPPDVAAGYGVGEFSALLAAGAFDFTTGLRLVQKRAELLSEVDGGGMLKVFGLDAEAVARTLIGQGFTAVSVAEYFTPNQVVIAGPAEHLESAAAWMQQAGAKRVVPLEVRGAFHTEHLWQVAAEFGESLQRELFYPPRLPVIANCTARVYAGNVITECLMRQLCSPIQWTESIRYLKTFPRPTFSEVGPGKILSSVLYSIPARSAAAV